MAEIHPDLRHPEKRKNTPQPAPQKPDWIRVRAPLGKEFEETQKMVKKSGLVTVCEEAACPNIGQCWQKKHVTVMILGSVCTRACAFCNVATGRPDLLDPHEPEKIAASAKELGLEHMVITSVDRDDLSDGGADHFAQCINKVRDVSPKTTLEVLTPDFFRKGDAWQIVCDARPDVFNHNLETVPRLYPSIRPSSRYFHSLKLLSDVKQRDPSIFTKSGLMVGLGESDEEVYQVMDDMRAADVDFITIGQYLQPTPKHAPLVRFVTPAQFKEYEAKARSKGFLMVSATPLTRSSYLAGDDFVLLREARNKKLAAKK